ncbi:related to L-sorbosone dehydrogenase [Phialocephala subalpina]|uniref:Related to L-sorbosone dehydrogenase n=1 Tax=Phialocephala subalpina TaxID=576137 RepID=A0A1L7X0I4_9HELO|nr:related to L-sorbosone dehydrogenase [Phialocephala subalpina]
MAFSIPLSSIRSIVILATLLQPSLAVPQACSVITPAATPVFASGYSGRVVVNRLKSPRGGGIRRITFTDNGGTDVCIKSSAQIIKDNTLLTLKLNHGIELSPDGRTLYVSSLTNLYSYPYDPDTGTVGANKTLTVPDTLLMQRGSDGNIDPGASDVKSGRSQVRIFSMSKLNASTAPNDYSTSGTLLGYGLRNSVGWAEHPISGGICSVENNADDIIRSGIDIHTNNPGEEMNYHGILNDTKSPQRGADYGYPTCFAAWDTSVLPTNTNLRIGSQFVLNDLNTTNTDSTCSGKANPRLTFPAHTAPLDMKFKKDGSAAYVSFHGSWDRAPPDGFRVSRIAFGKDGMPIEGSESKNSTVDVMWNTDNTKCPNGCFRPTAFAFDSKERLFMSSDQSNEIWIIGGT